MQETQVRSLVWGDVTCHRTTKSVRHSYQAHILEPLSYGAQAASTEAREPKARALQLEKPLEKACTV